MPRHVKKRSRKTGAPPGTLMHIGERKAETTKITIIDYDEGALQEKQVQNIEECFPFKAVPTVTWINVDGIHEVEILEKLGSCYGLHPLILEDILNTDQRPKVEDLGDYLYVVLRMLSLNETRSEIQSEQVSLVLGRNFVISFQEREGDVFDPIRERLRGKKGRIRTMGADYLAYALVDVVVDNYFAILEKFGDKIEALEGDLIASPTSKTLHAIHALKREMIFLRKFVWPLREVISSMERAESSLIKKETTIYLRDVHDHTIQVIDTIETFREMMSGMLDTYLTSISNKMNEVMKVLTIIATIFIPLSFIAGVYGMNFEFMPETRWHWGYFAVLFFMFATGLLMLILFRKKKWL
ncbi:MAG: magnesium and cobalt transport protein CorA [Candidatus Abyssobacteria bacterium SURF_17]|uniref:Magnesium transport protein CorA n=1 Tax=Candidatus Abyssobacteria bacterium SURF_17 TaxID=2093361 RepID=A0A419EVC4_9BACT|nr:MAG: magnesium and cobalt transport protein CorA [Candidatus Abyssubacteria bacterium SURF_17]